jgi:hypothetical protein
MKHYIMHTINWIVLKVSTGAAWELRKALFTYDKAFRENILKSTLQFTALKHITRCFNTTAKGLKEKYI